ncbi:VOC family protein [Euzebya tangerina]|uniref:VOC family protein n=1 Tax=Euzebya tangerina TaxID=591198 RepID=UPI000E317839|nr:VOC family protein [Euzebya tangerina]
MPTRNSYEPGTPCWIDLNSPDVDASTAFYTGLFGWKAEDQFAPDGTRIYTNFMHDGANVAGMGAQPPEMAGMPNVWMSYVATEDIETTLARATEAGGEVMMPAMDVMEEGRMAIIRDPSGASISLWQAGNHIGAGVCNEANTWSWNELMSRDLEPAKAFYSHVFGWEYDVMDMPTGTYHVIKGGEEGGLGGLMDMPDEVPQQVPSYWGVYFTVEDAAAMLAKANDLGASTTFEPMTTPGVGTMAGVTDPLGGAFTLMQPESS